MQRKVTYFIILSFLLGCSRLFIPDRKVNSARFNVCMQDGNCGTLIVSGDVDRMRVLLYGSIGLKIFEGYLTSDSIQVVYVYSSFFDGQIKTFIRGQNVNVIRNFFGGLLFGFSENDVITHSDQIPQLSSCVGFVCFSLYFNKYNVRSDRLYLNEGQLYYGTSAIFIRRY